MDKYEFSLKIEQLKKLIEQEDYVTALKIVETIDWNRVRNTNLLNMAATVYEKTDNLQDAKDMLILAFERAPVGKHILFKLTELSCRTGDLDEAEDYYHEYRAIDSTDINNYLLQYMILKARHAPYERQILPLERYCEIDPDEKWLYELAASYEYANRIEDCVKTCDKLALLYGDSTYSIKALRLKSRYTELTDVQRNLITPRTIPEDKIRYVEPVYSESSFRNETPYEEDPAESRRAMVDSILGDDEPVKPNAGVYEDREYRYSVFDDAVTEDRPEVSEEERAERNADMYRRSDELAADRYANEDAAFEAYVKAYETGSPIPADVAADAADEAGQEDVPEGDGIQMAFDFGGGEPVVINDPAELAEAEAEPAEADAAGAESAAAEAPAAVPVTVVPVTAEAVTEAEPAAAAEPATAAESAPAPVFEPAVPAETAPAAAPAETAPAAAPAMTQSAAAPAAVQPAAEERKVEFRQVPTAAVTGAAAVAASAENAAKTVVSNTAETAFKAEEKIVRVPEFVPQAKTQFTPAPAKKPAAPAVQEAAPAGRFHMIVEAETEAEGLSIAIDELKNIHEENHIDHASIKTSAAKLNQNGITTAILDRVRGKDFVIENAGSLNVGNIETIYEFIREDRSGAIVVLIDTPEGFDKLEEIRPEIFDICDYISDADEEEEKGKAKAAEAEPRTPVPYKEAEEKAEKAAEPYDEEDDDAPYEEEAEKKEKEPAKRSKGEVTAERFYNVKEVTPSRPDHQMEIDEFAQYCAQYAAEIDCSITGTSMLALYERIELMEEDGIPLTKTNAEQLIEEAADRAEKPPIGKRLTGMFRSKYDKNGLLILKEDDFIY